MRTFDSGATRDDNADKLDYRGFLSSKALKAFAVYMHSHRMQADGQLRGSDNWKAGIPMDTYMESMWRHFWEVWDTFDDGCQDMEQFRTALCALLFNVQGMLHEVVKQTGTGEELLITIDEALAQIAQAKADLQQRLRGDDEWAPEYGDDDDDYC